MVWVAFPVFLTLFLCILHYVMQHSVLSEKTCPSNCARKLLVSTHLMIPKIRFSITVTQENAEKNLYRNVDYGTAFHVKYPFQIISYCAFGIIIYLMQELLDSLGLRDFFLQGRVTDKHAVRSNNVNVDTSCKCDYNVPCMMKFS